LRLWPGKTVTKKQSKQKAPQIIVRKSVRGVTRREAFDKAQVGFDARYKKKWVEKVGWSRQYEEGWERIFGKKKAV
jgi:hypothetical protein